MEHFFTINKFEKKKERNASHKPAISKLLHFESY